MMLECPDVFNAPFVPDGWTASGRPGQFYQLEPPTNDAAIHISVYERNDGPLKDHEARDALAAFLTKAILTSHGEIRALDEGRKQQRAFSRFIRADEDGEPEEWLTACIIWPRHMLICTFNSAPGHIDLPAAERMFASIAPPVPSRWRWGRG
jgi:hypothetical protein